MDLGVALLVIVALICAAVAYGYVMGRLR